MALSGELAKYIGNEMIKTGGKELAKAGAKSALSSLVPSVATKVGTDLATKAGGSSLRKLLVNQAPSIAKEIPVAVGDAGKISLYRGMHADSPANLQKYIADMKDPNIVPRTYTGNAFAGDGYHFYDNIEGAREYARDGINLGEPYGYVVKIDVPKNRFIGINSQNGNDAESFIGRALERGSMNAPEVGNKDFRNYIQRNGILGSHNTSPFGDNSQYVVMNNDATAGLKAIENYENGELMEDIINSGADKYLPVGTKIKFNKDLSIRKTGGNFGHKGVKGMRGGSAPNIQQSKVELSPQQQEFFKDSVVRNENGELIPMYHGSNSNFTIFDKSKGGQSNKSAKVGFWFTPNKEGAEKWAGQSWWGDNEPKVYETYLNIKKPLVYKEVDNSSQIARLESELKLAEDDISSTSRGSKEYYDAYKRYNNIASQIEDLSYTDPYEQFRSHIYAMEGKSPSQANTGGVGMVMDNEDEAIKKYVEMLKSEGYDGIIIKGTNYDRNTMGSNNDQYIVFDPEQIKNVDNRKPTKNKDIRYAIAAALGIGSIIGPYMNSQKSVDNIE